MNCASPLYVFSAWLSVHKCICEPTQPIANTDILKLSERGIAAFLYRHVKQPPPYSVPTGSLLLLLSDTSNPTPILHPVVMVPFCQAMSTAGGRSGGLLSVRSLR